MKYFSDGLFRLLVEQEMTIAHDQSRLKVTRKINILAEAVDLLLEAPLERFYEWIISLYVPTQARSINEETEGDRDHHDVMYDLWFTSRNTAINGQHTQQSLSTVTEFLQDLKSSSYRIKQFSRCVGTFLKENGKCKEQLILRECILLQHFISIQHRSKVSVRQAGWHFQSRNYI